jgi:hypothetical protein
MQRGLSRRFEKIREQPVAPTLLLGHDHRRTFGRVFEEWLRHSFRHPYAAVRCGKWRNIPLVHRVPAIEEHGIGHSRAIEMCARRPAVFARIDIRSHHVPVIIHVITEFARDMVSVLGNDVIVARRGGEPRFAGGDGRFTDHMLTFVKVSLLLADMDDNLR